MLSQVPPLLQDYLHFETNRHELCLSTENSSFNLQSFAKKLGRPAYFYIERLLKDRITLYQQGLRDIDSLVCCAVKVNNSLALLKSVADEGFGADIVSGGELHRALEAGFTPEKIIFSGVAKTESELIFALETQIYSINIESLAELHKLSSILDRRPDLSPARIALRLIPEVEGHTLSQISTGSEKTKFGIPLSHLDRALALINAQPRIILVGLTVHAGSQLHTLSPFEQAYDCLLSSYHNLSLESQATIEFLDFGGGIGVDYEGKQKFDYAPFFNLLEQAQKITRKRIIIEPGRSLFAECGLLLSEVLYLKNNPTASFALMNVGMNQLLRPALYGAKHQVLPLKLKETQSLEEQKSIALVGPICETTDTLAEIKTTQNIQEGDCLAFLHAGAYCSSMQMLYNDHPLLAEFLLTQSGELVKIKEELAPSALYYRENGY